MNNERDLRIVGVYELNARFQQCRWGTKEPYLML